MPQSATAKRPTNKQTASKAKKNPVQDTSPQKPTPTAKKQFRRWTKEEDELLYNYLRKYITQPLRDTFLEVAKKTCRTPAAVQGRWYSHVSYTQKDNPAYMITAHNYVAINRKGFKNKNATFQVRDGFFGKIIKLLS